MSFCRLLRRAFSTTATARIHNPNSRESIKAISTELLQESDPTRLVQKFKDSSELSRFRNKNPLYEIIIRRLTKEKQFKAIEEILEHQKKYPDFSNEKFSVRLITLYGKAGMFDNAQKLFDEMPLRNVNRTVLSFNALLAACVNSNKLDMVEKIFEEVPTQLSVEPDLFSYNTMIKANCEKGSIDSAISLMEEMEKKGVKPDKITFNTISDCFYRKGSFEEAEKIMALMLEKNIVPDIRSYNAKLQRLALEKRTEEGAQLVEELKKNGLKPDMFTFNALIKGFVNEGNWEEAKRWYGELVESGVRLTTFTFEILVPLACEKGEMEYAFELCQEIFKRGFVVDVELLQPVVDGLAKASRMEEAEELVKLGNAKRYNLKLPSEEV